MYRHGHPNLDLYISNAGVLNLARTPKLLAGEFLKLAGEIFSKKITTTVVIFLEKTSPANFKNSPVNNFGVRARLRTPV